MVENHGDLNLQNIDMNRKSPEDLRDTELVMTQLLDHIGSVKANLFPHSSTSTPTRAAS